MTCRCALPPGSTYCHCRGCCSTFLNLGLFDAHRKDGVCYDLEGVTQEDGLWGTLEGHEKRRVTSQRFKKGRGL